MSVPLLESQPSSARTKRRPFRLSHLMGPRRDTAESRRGHRVVSLSSVTEQRGQAAIDRVIRKTDSGETKSFRDT